MGRKITSEEEYQRRKRLLEKHKREETADFRKRIIKTAIPAPGVADFVETIVDAADDSD